MDIASLIIAVAIPLWLNIKATRLVSRDADSERAQKIAQLLFVWLVPLIGAIVVFGVHRPEERSSGTYPAEGEEIDESAHSSGRARKIAETVDGD